MSLLSWASHPIGDGAEESGTERHAEGANEGQRVPLVRCMMVHRLMACLLAAAYTRAMASGGGAGRRSQSGTCPRLNPHPAQHPARLRRYAVSSFARFKHRARQTGQE